MPGKGHSDHLRAARPRPRIATFRGLCGSRRNCRSGRRTLGQPCLHSLGVPFHCQIPAPAPNSRIGPMSKVRCAYGRRRSLAVIGTNSTGAVPSANGPITPVTSALWVVGGCTSASLVWLRAELFISTMQIARSINVAWSFLLRSLPPAMRLAHKPFAIAVPFVEVRPHTCSHPEGVVTTAFRGSVASAPSISVDFRAVKVHR